MKVGDLVLLRVDKARSFITPTGVIVAPDPSGWWWVLSDWGEEMLWPEEQMQVV